MASIVDRKQEIVDLYAKGGWSCSAIARSIGVQTSVVTAFLQRSGLRVRPIGPKRLSDEFRKKVASEYANGESPKRIRERYGVAECTVREIARSHGVPLRRAGDHSRRLSELEMAAAIRMFREGASMSAIGDTIGCFSRIVAAHLRASGIEIKARGREARLRWQNKYGYWVVKPKSDAEILGPMMNRNGEVLEHRAVMALNLGRALTRKETVHHINGDRGDNAIGNLQLRMGGHGKNACFRCMNCGSANISAVSIA